jgi:hypothetical protein
MARMGHLSHGRLPSWQWATPPVFGRSGRSALPGPRVGTIRRQRSLSTSTLRSPGTKRLKHRTSPNRQRVHGGVVDDDKVGDGFPFRL